MARQRFFSPVVVRGEEEKGVRIWGYGKTAYSELLNLVLNPDYGDVTDLEAGTDLVINYGKPPGAQFPQTSITPRRRSSAAAKTPERVKEMLDQLPDFNNVFERKTPEQVQEILDEFLLSGEDAEASSTETTKFGNKKTEDGNAVDKAFAELLG